MTMGLFGLGPPEIAVILAVGGFVLGPTKLAELARDFGKVAGELKDVPKEFQEGLAEGEAEMVVLVGIDFRWPTCNPFLGHWRPLLPWSSSDRIL